MIDQEEKPPGMDLSLPMTIAELIAIRGRIVQSWEDANAAIAGIDTAFNAIRDKDFTFHFDSGGQRWEAGRPFDVPAMTHALDFSLYEFALGKLNITKAMTGNARAAFLEKMKAKKTPFSEKELLGLAQNAHVLFRDSSLNTVRQVFGQLVGVGYNGGNWGSGKKDNLRKVEKVFRIGWSDIGIADYSGTISNAGWRYGSASGCFQFNDLLTACRLIEGQGFTDYSNNIDSMTRTLPRGQKWLDTGYFIVTAYKNRNVKVNWNDAKLDVLDKLNAIGSGMDADLPDPMRKRYQANHFKDGGAPDPVEFFQVTEDMAPSDDKDFAFYPTPAPVAERMVALAELPADHAFTILEPSAGDGAILRAIPDRFGVHAVEFNHHRAAKLRNEFLSKEIIEGDFLRWTAGQWYSRILMNPPFNDRLEAVHIIKAWGCLKPGGILVAILPDGWFTRDDLKSRVLRAFLQANEYKPSEKLSDGTFKRTRIITRIVTLKRQADEK